jgi:choline dehydrogenase-like flavoprotein
MDFRQSGRWRRTEGGRVIEDGDMVPAGTRLDADVCVVGGGPAGIALALSLSGRGLRVLLMESGRLGQDRQTQSLYEGEVADERLHSPLDKYRQRRIGGSSAIWGGRCVPLDPIDFETRGYVSHSGWPLSYDELLPYYPEANALAEAGRFAYDADDALGPDAAPMIEGFRSSVVRTNGLERFSCPTHFGRRYAKRLQVAPDVKVLLGSNCTGIRLRPDARAVHALDFATLKGRRFSVTCRAAVLAAGGLENARLLLASRDVAPAGIGNEYDVVGRYYMCHIAGNVGTLTVAGEPRQVRHGYEVTPEGVYCRRRLAIAPHAQRQLGLANAVARLHFPRITDPSHRSGVLSGLFLARRLISYEYGKRLSDGGDTSFGGHLRHFANVVADPLDTAGFLFHWLRRRSLARRKYPSVILRNKSNRFSLELHGEQLPRAQSRVMLAERADRLGMPQLRVDWRYGTDDIESLRRMLDLLAREFEHSGVARFEYERDGLQEDLSRYGAYGGHHLGTTRMGTDLRTSVVDADCRVHSVANLFVAGSSVFPTSSQANPTLTILALALRLADTLSRRFGSGHIGCRAMAVEGTNTVRRRSAETDDLREP